MNKKQVAYRHHGFYFDVKNKKEWIVYNKTKHVNNFNITNELNRVINHIKYYLTKDGTYSGDLIQKTLFPNINADVFISHSHNDALFAQKIASSINIITGKEVFCDEGLWGSADNFLQVLNNSCLYFDPNAKMHLYDHKKCCRNASIMYMLLSDALQKMIYKCKYFIFIATSESIYSLKNQTTLSPWIFFELKTINNILENESFFLDKQIKLGSESMAPTIELPIILDNLTKITNSDFNDFVQSYIEKQ